MEIRQPDQYAPPRDPGYEFRLQEQAASADQALKDRENRNFEINLGGVWLSDCICGLCRNPMMLSSPGGVVKVHCPRCNVQIRKEFLSKYVPASLLKVVSQ